MIPEEMERTMQFLFDNQAAHDARLAEIETKLNKLTETTSALADSQQELANTRREMQADMRSMFGNMEIIHSEFRGGLQKILTVSEQSMASVRQVVELEARTISA